MSNHNPHNNSVNARAHGNVQTPDVYKDLPFEVNRRVSSLEARFGSRQNNAEHTQSTSPVDIMDFMHGSPTLPGLGPSTRATHNGLSSPLRQLNTHDSPQTPTRAIKAVLATNSLKANSSPSSSRGLIRDESLKYGPVSGQKRRVGSEDHDNTPRKTPKLQHQKVRIAGFRRKAEPPIALGKHGEPPPSGIPARPSKFKEGSMNDRTSTQPLNNVADPVASDAMEIDSNDADDSFIQFTGVTDSARRSQAMYTFGSTMRGLNPFKAVGNLFGRTSTDTTPTRTKKQQLISQEVAKQVEDRMRQFESRIFDRLVAHQTSRDTTDSSAGTPKSASEGLDTSLISFQREMDARLSHDELLPPSPPKDYDFLFGNSANSTSASPEKHLSAMPEFQASANTGNKSRGLFATLRRSPAKKVYATRSSTAGDRAPSALSGLFTSKDPDSRSSIDSSLNDSSFKQESTPKGSANRTPAKMNKASQHLKKMASKMHLRSRKSVVDDSLAANNDDYKVMKKKNKEEILRDYLHLQKEKQELERQLAKGLSLADDQDKTPTISRAGETSHQKIQREMKPLPLVPHLSECSFPDFSITKHKSKENKQSESAQERGLTSSVTAIRLPAVQKSNPAKHKVESDTPMIDDEGNSDGVIPPVPKIPAKYTSKVHKSTHNTRSNKSRASDDKWLGWDDEVF